MQQQAILLSKEDPALSAAAVPGWAEKQHSGSTGRYHLVEHYSCILCSSQALRCVQDKIWYYPAKLARHHNSLIRRAEYCNPTVRQPRMGTLQIGCARQGNCSVVRSKPWSGVSYL